jgi:hypothetical protein
LNHDDPRVPQDHILGHVARIERRGKQWLPAAPSVSERLLRWWIRRSSFATRVVLWRHARRRQGAPKRAVFPQPSALESA